MDTLHGVLCNFYILWIKSPSRIGMLLKIHNAISRQRLIDWCCSILVVSWRLRQRLIDWCCSILAVSWRLRQRLIDWCCSILAVSWCLRQRLIDWCCSILAVSWRLRQRKYTKKPKNQKDLHRFASSKRPHTITKMNDSKNMDNTIAGSVNASS